MKRAWLFSPGLDLTVFLGSAVLSLLLLGVGARAGVLEGDTPEWAWIPGVLLVDVAHVWATGFRVYLDPAERRRRPALYTLVPLLALGGGVLLYSEGELLFWRALAYLAVFHFVRQQAGWVALYRARAGERGWAWLDLGAVYAATLWPLLHWHAHLPRAFQWFVAGDFVALPRLLDRIGAPVWALFLVAYTIRAAASRGASAGKHVVVYTTYACWFVGIVLCDSDYAFTVTNVFIHGVPYLALVFLVGRRSGARPFAGGPALFVGALWALAYAEELLWDRLHWHERGWLFGSAWDAEGWTWLLVPLLATPQIVHYVLDGFVWRRRDNPDVAKALEL